MITAPEKIINRISSTANKYEINEVISDELTVYKQSLQKQNNQKVGHRYTGFLQPRSLNLNVTETTFEQRTRCVFSRTQ